MTNLTKITLFISVLFFAFAVYSGCKVWKATEKTAEMSCLASIHTETVEALELGQIQLNGKSQELTKEEISNLVKQGNIGDCGGRKYIFENVHISIGEATEKSKIPIRVWTNGDDGIAGTTDDLLFPNEENADQSPERK